MVCHFEPDEMATALYAVFDPARRQMTISVAGHPLPLMTLPTREAQMIEVCVDPPIGSDAAAPRRATEIAVSEGATIYLFRDLRVAGARGSCHSSWGARSPTTMPRCSRSTSARRVDTSSQFGSVVVEEVRTGSGECRVERGEVARPGMVHEAGPGEHHGRRPTGV